MTTANISFDILDKVCLDLLTTAVEGGSAYWLRGQAYYQGNFEKDSSTYGVCKITDCFDVDDEEHKFDDVDFATIRKGIVALLSPDADVNSDTKKNIVMMLFDPDNCDYDANDADCVLQMGMFGELVYG